MDIALKLKRAVATLAAGALFASSAGIAIAQTFNDVPTDAWYYNYVEQLVDDGVIDAADNYRPADALNRAELVKIAITAIDGLAGYEAPATPTFDDVAADAWFFDYVEAAVQLGIVNGYTDANGNLTGMFGPGDTVNRAAATKILVNAFSVPTDLTPGSSFPDVVTGDWFHDYVVTAYNQSVLDGYDNGFFGPGDPVTRAQVAKLTVTAQSPVERTETPDDDEDDDDDTTPASEGDLEVSLNDDTAASSTLPGRASGVALAAFDFTADEDDVMVSNLVVTRGGVGKAGDWDDLYLYDGTHRLTTGRTINNDTNQATFPLKLLVEAGTTTTLTLVGDVADVTDASSQHYFYVSSAADSTSNAQSTSGDFPIAGNTFTMSGTNTKVNTVTIEPGTAPAKVTLGDDDAEIASIKIEAGSENDVALHQLALTNGGSLSSSRLTDLRLLRGTDEVATAAGFEDDIVTFTLDTPYVIEEGQTKTFYVRSAINGGRTTDNIILYLDESTDMIAVDQQYGFGGDVINEFTQGLANTVTLEGGDVTVTDNGPASTQIATESTNNELMNFSVTTARDLTVRSTDVLVTIQDPLGGIPTFNDGNTTVLDAAPALGAPCTASEYNLNTVAHTTTFTAGDMFQVGNFFGRIVSNDGSTDGGGLCAASASDLSTLAGTETLTERNPYVYVEDVKIVDLDTDATVAGPLTQAEDGVLCTGAGTPSAVCNAAGSYSKNFSEDYELTGGETRHFSVQVDVSQELVTGYQVRAAVQYPSTGAGKSDIKDLTANEFVETADVIGAGSASLTGNFMIVAENSMAVSAASTPTSNSYVRGAADVPGLGISLSAGDAGDITVKRLNVRLYANTAAGVWGDAEGDQAANNFVSTVTLYDGNDIVSGPESIDLVDGGVAGYTAGTDYFVALFDDLDLVIPSGGTKDLIAKVKLLNTSTGTNYLALDVVPSEIIAEDDDSDTVTPAGTAINGSTTKVPLITILGSGTLTASSQGNPDADIVMTGSVEQLVSKYKFTAVDEDFQIKKLTISNDLTGDFGDADVLTSAVSKVTIKYPDVNGVTRSASASLSGTGQAKFAGLDFFAPAGSDVYLEVYVDINTKALVGPSISGKKLRLGLKNTGNDITTFEAIGQSSSANLNFAGAPAPEVSNSGTVDEFVVRRAKPVISQNSVPTKLTSTTMKLFDMDVTVDGTGSLDVARYVFEITSSGGVDLDNFRVLRNGSNVDATKVDIYSGAYDAQAGGTPIAAGTFTIVVSMLQSDPIIGSANLQIRADATGVTANDTVSVKLSNVDENLETTGKTSGFNANTARLFDTTAGEGIFATYAAYQQTGTSEAFVWSDSSADPHTFSIADGGSSADFTNGYLLDINELDPVTLAENN